MHEYLALHVRIVTLWVSQEAKANMQFAHLVAQERDHLVAARGPLDVKMIAKAQQVVQVARPTVESRASTGCIRRHYRPSMHEGDARRPGDMAPR